MRQFVMIGAVILVAFAFGLWNLWPEPVLRPVSLPATPAPFVLTDSEGKSFTPRDLAGRWTWAYFGYTFCPDLCPNTLGLMQRAATGTGLPPDLQLVFISLDPARDKGDRLGEYAAFFEHGIRMATATQRELRRLTDSIGVNYGRNNQDRGDRSYQVFHPSAVFIFGPDGRLHHIVEDPARPEDVQQAMAVLAEGKNS